jgi:hypothetical protein
LSSACSWMHFGESPSGIKSDSSPAVFLDFRDRLRSAWPLGSAIDSRPVLLRARISVSRTNSSAQRKRANAVRAVARNRLAALPPWAVSRVENLRQYIICDHCLPHADAKAISVRNHARDRHGPLPRPSHGEYTTYNMPFTAFTLPSALWQRRGSSSCSGEARS